MTRYLNLLQVHNVSRTLFALGIVASGYMFALFITDAASSFPTSDPVSYSGAETAVIAKPFVRLTEVMSTAGEPIDGSLRIIAVGDIMLDRGVQYIVNKVAKGDQTFPFQHIVSEIQSADIAFGNLEGSVSDQGSNVGSIYSFRMPVHSVQVLEKAGFDVLSFANNHVGDWGRDAFIDTLRRFSVSDTHLVGAGLRRTEAEKVFVKEVNGTKVGFLAFTDVGPYWLRVTDTAPGVLIAEPEDIDRVVRQANAGADILVVSFHFGEEYQTSSNTRQRMLARTAVDAGADVVIGHHPHVAQEIEEYQGAVIAYSLGNFVFDQRFSEDTSKSIMLELDIKEKKIVSFAKKEIIFNAYFQPIPAWDISTTIRSSY